MRGLFRSFLEEVHLVDVEPVKLTPTWCNFRTGSQVGFSPLKISQVLFEEDFKNMVESQWKKLSPFDGPICGKPQAELKKP